MTIDHLKECTKVTDIQLDTEIEEADMQIVACEFNNPEVYSRLFELPSSEQQDVKEKKFFQNNQSAMALAMRLWKYHDPSVATYRSLVMFVLSMGEYNVAIRICTLLAKNCKYKFTTCPQYTHT